jgi:hypothetical protein
MKQSIYKIQNEFLVIQNQLIEQDGEYTEDQINSLAINETDLENKAVGYCFVIKDYEDDVNAIDNEMKRLTQKKKVLNSAIERLKLTILNAMNLYGKDEIKTSLIKLSFRNSESVEITNESQLDACFIVTKTVSTPDKKAIKDAIKSGQLVCGATISYNKNLQIK